MVPPSEKVSLTNYQITNMPGIPAINVFANECSLNRDRTHAKNEYACEADIQAAITKHATKYIQ